MKTQIDKLEIGIPLEVSWGYDQTNVDFYQIVRISDKSVWFKKIDGEAVPGTGGYMYGNVRAKKDAFCDPNRIPRDQQGIHRRPIKSDSCGIYVPFEDRRLRPTTFEEEHYESSYA
jgi:hypothetical protein